MTIVDHQFSAGGAGLVPGVSLADIITGECLQSLADISVITPPIAKFHKSLPRHIRLLRCPGEMTSIDLTQLGRIGPVRLYQGTRLEAHVQAFLAPLKAARSIFVYTHLVPAFIETLLPHLTQPFVLITHNSDDLITEPFRPLLDDPRLARWFGQGAFFTHPKLECLPIGVANAQWKHGDLAALAEVAASRVDKTGLASPISNRAPIRTGSPCSRCCSRRISSPNHPA
jgi:hypothetical protein